MHEPDEAALSSPFARRLARAGLRSVVLAPLRHKGETTEVMIAARRGCDAFPAEDREFLLQLSTHVSLAGWHAQLNASLREANDALRAGQQALVRHERLRALGQMASGVAHDIQNLVFPAATFALEVLDAEPGLSPGGRERLHDVVRTLDDITVTVDRLREFYRPREVARVYGTVQRHNAEISIDSTPGLGTCMTLRFPPVVSAAPDHDAPPRLRPAPAHRQLRILVIDDDRLVLEALQAML